MDIFRLIIQHAEAETFANNMARDIDAEIVYVMIRSFVSDHLDKGMTPEQVAQLVTDMAAPAIWKVIAHRVVNNKETAHANFLTLFHPHSQDAVNNVLRLMNIQAMEAKAEQQLAERAAEVARQAEFDKTVDDISKPKAE